VIEKARQEMDSLKLDGCIVGHVGEGNFHCLFPCMEEDEEEMRRVWEFSDRLVKWVFY
jgi:D-lactate dehydrogenase (cytochrome)